jgi:type VI secretion system secreted protein Hcp
VAQVDMFLKIDGVEGESPDAKHKGEIEIGSFSWGAQQMGTASTGGGAGAGRAHFQDFSFTKKYDKASPTLMFYCASGKHIPTVEFTARKAGGDQQEYLKIKFSDVLVSSYQCHGDANSVVPTDAISLNFSKIEKEYKEQKADGTLGGQVKKFWSIKENKGG